MRYLVFILLPSMLLAIVPESLGGDLSSPKGFKLTYPEGWQSVDSEKLGKRQLYVVTCTASTSHWTTAWPGFKQMIDSLQIDVPAAQ